MAEAGVGAHLGMRSTSCTSGIRRSIAMVRASPVTSPASDAARACLGLVLGLARVRSRPATTHSRSRPRAISQLLLKPRTPLLRTAFA